MQYIIEIRPDQDEQFILTVLEKLGYNVRPVDAPKKEKSLKKNGLKPSERLSGKLSHETAEAMLAQIQTERATPKNNTIENLLSKLGDYYDPEFADNIEEAQKHWKKWTIETW